jgi:hypothetical protein
VANDAINRSQILKDAAGAPVQRPGQHRRAGLHTLASDFGASQTKKAADASAKSVKSRK